MRRIMSCCAAVVSLASCQSWPQTDGEVSVSRPQVFTRERLLNERLGETNWLRDQLDRPFEQGFQGFRDVREAAAFIADLQIRFDAAQRRAADIATATQDRQRERDDELAEIQHQISRTQLQQQLAKLKTDTSGSPAAPVPAEVTTQLAQLSKDVNALSDKVAAIDTKLTAPASSGTPTTARSLLENSQGRVLNPNLVEPTRAGATSRDRLEDESSFRDFVNGRLREASLDDTHDLNGYSLFELKFDATIVPGRNTRRSALAELTLSAKAFDWNDAAAGSFFDRLVQRTQEDINALVERQQLRSDVKKLNQTWQQRIMEAYMRSAPSSACSRFATTRNNLSRRISGGPKGLGDGNPNPPPSPQEDRLAADASRCLIAEYARQRFELALGRYFEFELVQAPGKPSEPEDRPLVKVTLKDKAALIDRLKRLEARSQPWVATVAPKEYAQSISDVASNQQIRQLGVLLNARDGRGASVDARTESYKQEQAIAHAIKRQPLASSFVRGSNRFGWILGPKYELQDGKPEFVHATSRYTFTASIVVPGWYSEVQLRGCGYWIDGDGRRSAPFALFGDDCSSDKSTASVSLPHNHRAILHALMDSAFDLLAEPEIYMLPDADARSHAITLRATPDACLVAGDKSCEQTIVIEGRDLWRNPTVFVGNQRADRVDVLPSMRGIAATFKSLRLPPKGRGGQAGAQDLFVSTSAGQDRLDEAIAISAASVATAKPFARLARRYLELAGAEAKEGVLIPFDYAPSAFPRAYADVGLRIRKVGAAQWKLVDAEPALSVGRLSFRVADLAAAGFGPASDDYECDLIFKFAPDDDWISMTDPSGRWATFYANRAERELLAEPQANADFSASRSFGNAQLQQLQRALRYSLPPDEALFFKAYPGLQDALAGRGGSATITLQFDEGTEAVELSADRAVVKGRSAVQPRITALNAKALEIVPEDERSITYRVGVRYRRGGGDPIEVALAGSPQLTAKGLKKVATQTAAETPP